MVHRRAPDQRLTKRVSEWLDTSYRICAWTGTRVPHMYNKLFAKILDSSIWLEADPTRIVWFTLLAAMDQDGFATFASVANLAHRARVSLDAATAAMAVLESPDPHSSDPDHDGRRVERVPGGWMVLNSKKYHELATRQHQREQTKQRVQRHREKQVVTLSNAPVTVGNDLLTPSDTHTDVHTDVQKEPLQHPLKQSEHDGNFERFWFAYPRKVGKGEARKVWKKLRPSDALTDTIIDAVRRQRSWLDWTKDAGKFIPHPATWLNQTRWEDDGIDATPSQIIDPQRNQTWSAECPHVPPCENGRWRCIQRQQMEHLKEIER